MLRAHDRIDVLVNNAGIYPHTPFGELTFEEWRRVLSTNLDGTFLMTKAVWPSMVERGYGRIVNISSATFWIGYPELAAYITSKGGLVGFTRGLAVEAGAHGITVNCITPGFIATAGSEAEDPTGELFDEIVAGQAVKRRGEPEDVAAWIAFLRARPPATSPVRPSTSTAATASTRPSRASGGVMNGTQNERTPVAPYLAVGLSTVVHGVG